MTTASLTKMVIQLKDLFEPAGAPSVEVDELEARAGCGSARRWLLRAARRKPFQWTRSSTCAGLSTSS